MLTFPRLCPDSRGFIRQPASPRSVRGQAVQGARRQVSGAGSLGACAATLKKREWTRSNRKILGPAQLSIYACISRQLGNKIVCQSQPHHVSVRVWMLAWVGVGVRVRVRVRVRECVCVRVCLCVCESECATTRPKCKTQWKRNPVRVPCPGPPRQQAPGAARMSIFPVVNDSGAAIIRREAESIRT